MNNINIICNESDHENFLFLAEFFKLCGIYVIKSIGKPYEELEVSRGYIPESRLDITKNFQWLTRSVIITEKDILKDAIADIADDAEVVELNVLADIYVDNDLMHHNVMERYFYAPYPDRVEKCLQGFQGAYRDLQQVADDSSRYYRHFVITCQSKINSLLGKLRRKKEYDTFLLMKEAARLSDEDPEYKEGYILAGVIADTDLNYMTYSEALYKGALSACPPMNSYIHFRSGRYYEKIDHDKETALKEYQETYALAPDNYRALYKIAFLNFEQGHIGKAVQEYQRLVELISVDLYNSNLEPIQLEYLFKTYKKLYEIYDIWLKQKNNSQLMLENICSLGKVIDKDFFFSRFYDKYVGYAKEEREAIKKHFDIITYQKMLEALVS